MARGDAPIPLEFLKHASRQIALPIQVWVGLSVLRLLPGGITGMEPLGSVAWKKESASWPLSAITWSDRISDLITPVSRGFRD